MCLRRFGSGGRGEMAWVLKKSLSCLGNMPKAALLVALELALW